MKFKKSCLSLCLFFVLSALVRAAIPSPQEFLGFRVGEDFKLANWSQILSYFDTLASSSDRVRVLDLGRSTLGRRFIMTVLTSPANMVKLEEFRAIQKKLHDPRSLKQGEKELLIRQGKAIILISCSIHSSEIAASQMSMELAFRLATQESPEIRDVLDNTILLLVPSLNPDGIDLVSDWYFKNLGTPYEASPMPWLYHHYTGHDNNRDWFMLTQKETQLATKVLYQEWYPLLVYDVHQMGSNGPRLFIPPYQDPINPNLDPLLLRELYVLVGNAGVDLTKAGKTGVATSTIFDAWYNMANRAAPLRHNALGILSEAASANLASPIFIRKSEIRLDEANQGEGANIQASYLEPWPGGWWRLRDIVDYEEIVALSFLTTIAKNKEKYLLNYALFAERQIEKGRNEPPSAYLVPLEQRDLPSAFKLVQVLQGGGAEVFEAQSAFVADEVGYPAGTFIVPLDQPYRAFIKDLLERKSYPIPPGQDAIGHLPYDEASWTLPLQMGVKVVQVTSPVKTSKKQLGMVEVPSSAVLGKGSRYVLLSNKTNNECILINRLHKKGRKLSYARSPFQVEGRDFPPGAVVVDCGQGGPAGFFSLAGGLGIKMFAADRIQKADLSPLSPPRIGIYQSWLANVDEGWLRWTLEQFEFPFKLIHNAEMKAGNLAATYGQIILPDMPLKALVEGRKEGEIPPQYAGGIGKEGISALEDFVRGGGRLIAIENSSEFAIKYLGLGVKNIIVPPSLGRRIPEQEDQKEGKERVYCPGSLLKVQVNQSHPAAYGLGNEATVFSFFSPVFVVDKGTAIATYPGYDPLLSGILINGEKIQGKAAAVECELGKGKVLLLGFNVIHRAQAHGTFKFLFNSLIYP